MLDLYHNTKIQMTDTSAPLLSFHFKEDKPNAIAVKMSTNYKVLVLNDSLPRTGKDQSRIRAGAALFLPMGGPCPTLCQEALQD